MGLFGISFLEQFGGLFIPNGPVAILCYKAILIFVSNLCGSYEVVLVLDLEKNLVTCSIYYHLFMLVCHVYWWLLMMRMLINQIKARGQISDDIQKVENVKIDIIKRWTNTIPLGITFSSF